MKKSIVAMALLILCLPLISGTARNQIVQRESRVTAEGSDGGPIIEWWNSTEMVILFWDGAYTGQTQETQGDTAWVNDTDGVSTVLFRYRWTGETVWMNRTASRISGNETNGQYEGNLTNAVWWNSTSEYPEVEGSGGDFYFKIWANDTLGHCSETNPMQYSGGYQMIIPPDNDLLGSDLILLTVGAAGVIVCALIAFTVLRRRP